MERLIKVLEDRIKYLDELSKMTPLGQNISCLQRKVEAEFILNLFKTMSKEMNNATH